MNVEEILNTILNSSKQDHKEYVKKIETKDDDDVYFQMYRTTKYGDGFCTLYLGKKVNSNVSKKLNTISNATQLLSTVYYEIYQWLQSNKAIKGKYMVAYIIFPDNGNFVKTHAAVNIIAKKLSNDTMFKSNYDDNTIFYNNHTKEVVLQVRKMPFKIKPEGHTFLHNLKLLNTFLPTPPEHATDDYSFKNFSNNQLGKEPEASTVSNKDIEEISNQDFNSNNRLIITLFKSFLKDHYLYDEFVTKFDPTYMSKPENEKTLNGYLLNHNPKTYTNNAFIWNNDKWNVLNTEWKKVYKEYFYNEYLNGTKDIAKVDNNKTEKSEDDQQFNPNSTYSILKEKLKKMNILGLSANMVQYAINENTVLSSSANIDFSKKVKPIFAEKAEAMSEIDNTLLSGSDYEFHPDDHYLCEMLDNIYQKDYLNYSNVLHTLDLKMIDYNMILLSKLFKKYHSGMDKDALNALVQYTGSDYSSMNSILSDMSSDTSNKTIRELSKAFETYGLSLPQEIPVYRGQKFFHSNRFKEMLNATYYIFPIFVSTSTRMFMPTSWASFDAAGGNNEIKNIHLNKPTTFIKTTRQELSKNELPNTNNVYIKFTNVGKTKALIPNGYSNYEQENEIVLNKGTIVKFDDTCYYSKMNEHGNLYYMTAQVTNMEEIDNEQHG